MKEECNLSLKIVSCHAIARNCEKTLEAHAAWLKEWTEKGINFLNNCIFVDESGFDINMRRSRGWSAKGSAAIVETPSTKANSQTVLGAISAFGVVNLTMRESGNIKEGRLLAPQKEKHLRIGFPLLRELPLGTIIQLINDTMDIMDEFPEMRGFHIIMDNAPIHVPNIIGPVIIRRGYIPVYLSPPPYSSELNPIKQSWDVLKSKVKRTNFSDIETLSSRIIKASEATPVEHLQHFIQHSVNQFGNCLNKHPI
ncbi:hypothetical protein G6F57_001967 [Rhizopus arrhizus]|nr:hypothetical protein G6F23_009799 [Rhizopus arrhizus]KAG1423719.1 hypothetical protein G6F58_002696 [Rhizopus delemar]KAG0780402.1 hypothetical protein G6F21_012148 [Rhizopus arrhizus]KAG0801231.1 hypothetical protein G6F22_001449 [Rhizopus arrhizus]KAG0805860.1 hypothetical protein G6F20_011575 [Rhizopus arrhizus]